MASWGSNFEDIWWRNERMVIKNAIYCFDNTVPIRDLISQPWEIQKWCDLIGPDGPEPQALNLIRTSHGLMWVCWWLSPLRCQSTKSRRRPDGDSDVNWRHGMPSDIIYAYIRKGVMLDRLDMTLLLNNESLGSRLWWHRKTEFGRFFFFFFFFFFLDIGWIQIVQKQHVRGFVESHAVFGESRVMLDVGMTRFSLSWNFS